MQEDYSLWQERTKLLCGEEAVERLKNAKVIVFGVGGVGAYAAEHLVRAGIGNIYLVDGDVVSVSNKNRQLVALDSTIGKAKVEVLKERFLDINAKLNCIAINSYVKDQVMIDILEREKYDFVIDAIDTLSPKIYLLYHSKRLGLKVVSSMGTGGKLDPTKLEICDISQTYNCPLADNLRKRLHKLGVYGGIYSVFSPERARSEAIREEESQNKKSVVGTISYMPAISGGFLASVVIRVLLGEEVKSKLPIPKAIKRKLEEEENF